MTRQRTKTRLAKWMARRMPEREELAKNKYLKPISHRFLTPELWRFSRRSVPRGVALGLFCGFIIPLGQIFLAAFLALPSRANVPLAMLVTFVTNPFTFPFWAVAANRIGVTLLNIDRTVGADMMAGQMDSEGWRAYIGIFETAGATVFGFVVLALVSAALGYLITSWVWRWRVGRRRARRLKAMERRLDRRLDAQGG